MTTPMTPAPELNEFTEVLNTRGVHAALRFLNARTPHRFTGVYRFDGDVLRNVALVDRFAPDVRGGDDFPMKDAYCAEVGRTGRSLEFFDARSEPLPKQGGRFQFKPDSPIISYCGVLLRDAAGNPFGTLCHYDVNPCQVRTSDLPLLEAAAPFIFRALGTGT